MCSEGYSSRFVCVCVSVCLSTVILALQTAGWLMSNTSGFRTRALKLKGNFPEMTAFRRYGMKTSVYTLLTTFIQQLLDGSTY